MGLFMCEMRAMPSARSGLHSRSGCIRGWIGRVEHWRRGRAGANSKRLVTELWQKTPMSLKSKYKRVRDALRRDRNRLATSVQIRSSGVNLVTRRWLLPAKTSETLFVLGSGSSITALSDTHWRHIKNGDSIGLNNWILHHHVPTFYSGEFMRTAASRAVYLHNLRVAAPRYTRTRSFFRLREDTLQHVSAIAGFRGRIALQEFIKGSSEADLSMRLRQIDLRRRGVITRLLHYSSSVDSAVLLGAYLGYKRVVLCGIDLKNVLYFYDSGFEHYTARGYLVPQSGQTGVIHKTNDPEQIAGVTVSTVMRILRDLPGAPELYVAHDASALHPDLPVYEWKQ